MESTYRSTWARVKLGDVCRVVPGYAFRSSDWQKTGIPVIKIKNIREDNTVDITQVDCVSEALFDEALARFLVKDGDILVAMTGATAGKVGRLRTDRPMLLNQRVARIDAVSIDHNFIWVIASSREYQATFFGLADGAAQPNMSGSQIEGVEIPLPPKSVQLKIAAIVSAYDDLIENNTRRIKTLEEMARLIYDEWFVKFRFRGYEKVRMSDSPLGPIPERFRTRNLFEVAEVTYGFPFKSKQFSERPVGKPVIRIRDINRGLSNTFTTEEAPEKYRVKNGDLLVGMDGEFHMGKWVGGEALLNQRVVRFRPKTGISPYLLYLALGAPIDSFQSSIVGTTVAHLSDEDLRSIEIVIPDEILLEGMNPTFDALLGLELNLRLRNINLRCTRDLLLPKLISGEIDVEKLDIAVRVDTSALEVTPVAPATL